MIYGFTIVLITVLIYVMGDYYNTYYDEREYTIMEDFAKSIQTEISVVAQLEDGYVREYTLPTTLRGKSYNITNDQDFISIQVGKRYYTLQVPKIQGNLSKGTNIIEKKDDLICINC